MYNISKKENYVWIAAKEESECKGCGFIKKVEASSLRCKSCYEIAVNTHNSQNYLNIVSI